MIDQLLAVHRQVEGATHKHITAKCRAHGKFVALAIGGGCLRFHTGQGDSSAIIRGALQQAISAHASLREGGGSIGDIDLPRPSGGECGVLLHNNTVTFLIEGGVP